MGRYSPQYIAYQQSGLVKDKQSFVIPDDAYVEMLNIYPWRGILKRRSGFTNLDRLRRVFSAHSYFVMGASVWTFNILKISGNMSAINIGGAPTLVITTPTPHGLSNGDNVVFSSVGGTTQLNGNTYAIANVTSTTFEVTQAAPGAYTSGGFWYSDRALTGEDNAEIACGTVVIVLDPGGANETTLTDAGDGTFTSSIPANATGTIDYITGDISITFNAPLMVGDATTLAYHYFPSLPVMGLPNRELIAINQEQLIAFDQKYSYQYSNANERFEQFGTAEWSGTNSDFFYATNYFFDGNDNKFFWVTNFFFGGTYGVSDPIRYYTNSAGDWTDFTPKTSTSANDYLVTSRVFVPYKGRLLALNTAEISGGASGAGPSAADTIEQFPQRVRFSWVGDPTDAVAWNDDVKGRGGFIDAPTAEHITGAAFVRDILIVYFERSTWRLRYTGNEILPFVWERINIEHGAESTFSLIQFDEGIVGVGDKAITVCNGNNVDRVDIQIRDQVWNFNNENNGTKRVQGIRDFFNQLVYWTYPEGGEDGTFPNRVLVYNYEFQSYAMLKDSFTCFGVWWRFEDLRWSDLVGKQWVQYNKPWNYSLGIEDSQNMVAGNQQGYVLVLNQQVRNDPSLSISAFTSASPVTMTVINHNLEESDWIRISGVTGSASSLNGNTYQVTIIDADTFSILEFDNTTQVFDPVVIGSVAGYVGCGEIETVQNFLVQSKQFNLFDKGRKRQLGYIDFLMDLTSEGEISVPIYIDSNYSRPMNPRTDDSFFNRGVTTQSGQFSTQDQTQEWKRLFCNTTCQNFTFSMNFDNQQMNTPDIVDSDVVLNAVILWTEQSGRLVY